MTEDERVLPTTIPHGRTARRLEWSHLPPHIRRMIEARIGSSVSDAASQGNGFTPGFASVLSCEDGSRHFVKAASTKAQRMFAESYREEARKLSQLPSTTPCPELLWWEDAADWVVLGIEYVEATAPQRPWRTDELTASLAMLANAAEVLTPAPDQLELESFGDEFSDWPGHWGHVRATRPDLPHLEEAAALAARYREVTAGDSVVHTDVRDDNILLCTDGRTLLCDWNWPVRGAAWLDTLLLMIGPRGDGIDVDAILSELALTGSVPTEHVDIVLALVAGYFFKSADDPVPPTSPYLRAHQAWQRDVVWSWLVERRGWHRAVGVE